MKPSTLSPSQKIALKQLKEKLDGFFARYTFIFTGKPGTGKTTVVKRLFNEIRSNCHYYNVAENCLQKIFKNKIIDRLDSNEALKFISTIDKEHKRSIIALDGFDPIIFSLWKTNSLNSFFKSLSRSIFNNKIILIFSNYEQIKPYSESIKNFPAEKIVILNFDENDAETIAKNWKIIPKDFKNAYEIINSHLEKERVDDRL